MARKPKRAPRTVVIAKAILEQYNCKNVENMQDVSGIEDKVLPMYTKGMSRCDIADTVEDIYGFEISHDTISAHRQSDRKG